MVLYFFLHKILKLLLAWSSPKKEDIMAAPINASIKAAIKIGLGVAIAVGAVKLSYILRTETGQERLSRIYQVFTDALRFLAFFSLAIGVIAFGSTLLTVGPAMPLVEAMKQATLSALPDWIGGLTLLIVREILVVQCVQSDL